jgi:hypothetical protein
MDGNPPVTKMASTMINHSPPSRWFSETDIVLYRDIRTHAIGCAFGECVGQSMMQIRLVPGLRREI